MGANKKMKYSVVSANGHSFGLVGNPQNLDYGNFEDRDADALFNILYGEIPASTLSRLKILIYRHENGHTEPKMDSLPGSSEYRALLDEMWKTHVKKNAGYAGVDNPDRWANFRLSEEVGVPAWKGAVIRLQDKFIRIINLLKNPINEQVGESVRDTLVDLAAYALIVVCLMDETKEKK